MKRLAEDVQFIKGVGPQRSKMLNKLGMTTIFDIFWNVPRTYLNRNKVDKIITLSGGDVVNIKGRIIATNSNRTRRGFNIFKARVEDDSGIITAVWFNQAYLSRQLKVGQDIFLMGKIKNNYGSIEIYPTEFDIIDCEESGIPIMPVYPLTEGLTQKNIRMVMLNALKNYLPSYPEILDESLRQRYNLCHIQDAFRNLHFPTSGNAYVMARRRLVFEELLLFELNIALDKSEEEVVGITTHVPGNDMVERIISSLPYELTGAQQRVINEISADMTTPLHMNRLLQGDVGSGKTVIAALAMARAISSGYQAAMMVPTEILAEQHFTSLTKIFNGTETVIARLTGATPSGERKLILETVARGGIDILVGTHALIQDEVAFQKLGLAVIDEQHRFGVRQRAKLGNKGLMPDVLVMTATPIPRTLALALYGNLNVSVIDQMPPGRLPVKTIFVSKSSREKAYKFIHTEIKKGRQAYIVCPLIEESEKQDLQAAESLYQDLRKNVFSDVKVGLLHGRMKAIEKEKVMDYFKDGLIDVLVTTTVIEVGVDIKNASVMLIEHAERFGISQLHQLRGRVGRGLEQAYCILVGNPLTDESRQRLKALVRTSDGFELANEDLNIRGPGDFWGIRQHGINNLKIANLSNDQDILQDVLEVSTCLIKDIKEKGELVDYIYRKFNTSDSVAFN